MAQHHGNEGKVKIGANTVAEVQGWEYTETDQLVPASSIGDTAIAYVSSGIIDGEGSIECYWDETDAAGQEVMDAGSSVVLHLQGEGDAIGDVEYTGTVVIESMSLSTPKDGIITRSFTFKGKLTQGTL